MKHRRRGRREKRKTSRSDALAEEVQDALSAFPTLSLAQSKDGFVLEGKLVLEKDGTPFDEYDMRLHVPNGFPDEEPKLFETGGRIAHTLEMHFNADGSACYEVFEYWLMTTTSPTVLEFMRGPVVNFFLSQTIYKLSNEWPFGARSHGAAGLIEAAADALGVDTSPNSIVPRLLVLRDWPRKGHHPCPCGSKKRFRYCHRDELAPIHKRISPKLAGRMIDRILQFLETEKATAACSSSSEAAYRPGQ